MNDYQWRNEWNVYRHAGWSRDSVGLGLSFTTKPGREWGVHIELLWFGAYLTVEYESRLYEGGVRTGLGIGVCGGGAAFDDNLDKYVEAPPQ